MKFIRDLIGKNRHDSGQPAPDGQDQLEQSYRDTIGSLADDTATRQRISPRLAALEEAAPDSPADSHAEVTPPAPSGQPQVNIWDLEPDAPATPLPASVAEIAAPQAQPAPARAAARARRAKTRLIGFEKSNGDIIDLFSDAPQSPTAPRVRFPVGWVVVAEGPGRGESYALFTGMSQIGRGDDQAIQLDFGDTAISRSNHAAIVYDPEHHVFWLGHGGKANIVRLNGQPVISNEKLTTGDVIRIGETTLRFVGLCDCAFNWAGSTDAEDDDVAIA